MTSQLRLTAWKRNAGAAVSAVLAAAIAGCGGQSMSSPSANITGNWEFTAMATSGTTDAVPVSVSLPVFLTSNNGSVSGNVVLPPATALFCVASCCGGLLSEMDPSLTGTVDAKGDLTLGSTGPMGSPVFSMSGVVNGAAMSGGSFSLTGACGAQGTIAGTEYPAIDGTYTGSVASQNLGQNFTVTLVLNQSIGPNSSGFLGLTGTLSLSGYSCLTSTALQVSTSFVGNSFGGELNITAKEAFGYTGTLSADGKTIALTYGLAGAGGSCNADYGKGTLTLQ